VTPLELHVVAGHTLLLKREDTHELGAFKWRGALATLERHRGDVVTASTGNHGAATAWAARTLGVRAIVYVPRDASRTKTALIEAQGAELRRVGADLDEAKDEARAWADANGVFFFEDGAEPPQYEGYAAIAEEILAEASPAIVVAGVGNGALAIGLARGGARVVGAVPKAAPVMYESLRAGRPVDGLASETFADGLAVRVAIPRAVELLRELNIELTLVSEREIAEGVRALAEAGIRAEGAAGAAVAAALRVDADSVAVVVTGRNVDDDLWQRAVERPESFSG
jgi:threonine dehydratase